MTEAQAVRTRHPKATTRATILTKAYEMYSQHRLVHGDERLSHVLDELGYTTGAGYQIWPNQAAFRRDLQIYVADNLGFGPLSPDDDLVDAIAVSGDPIEGKLAALADLLLTDHAQSQRFLLGLRFYGMGPARPDEVTQAMGDGYITARWGLGPALERVLLSGDLKVADPYTIGDVVATVVALLEGVALQAQAERPTREQLATVGGRDWFRKASTGAVLALTTQA